MNRRSFIQQTGFSIAALTFAEQKILSSLFQEPWKITMLTDTVGVFTERGGTIAFLLSKDGIAVVDSQFPDQSKHLIDELKKRSEKPIKLLINSHHHGDHSSGNISFKGITEHVLAHANSLKNQKRVAEQQKSEERQLYPDQTFTDTWTSELGKEKISLSYFGAAHTDGDALIHFEKANVVHVGDLVNNRRYPFIDRTAGASIRNWITVLEKATRKFDNKTIYVFGHASEGHEVYGKKEDVLLMKDYFEKLLAFTEEELKKGTTKEAFLQYKTIPGVTEWKGDGINRSLTAAWEEINEKA